MQHDVLALADLLDTVLNRVLPVTATRPTMVSVANGPAAERLGSTVEYLKHGDDGPKRTAIMNAGWFRTPTSSRYYSRSS